MMKEVNWNEREEKLRTAIACIRTFEFQSNETKSTLVSFSLSPRIEIKVHLKQLVCKIKTYNYQYSITCFISNNKSNKFNSLTNFT